MSVGPDDPVFLVAGFTLDVSPVLLLACYQLLWNVEGEGLCVTAEVLLQWNVFNFAYDKFEGLVYFTFSNIWVDKYV